MSIEIPSHDIMLVDFVTMQVATAEMYSQLKEQRLYLTLPQNMFHGRYKLGEKLILNNGEVYGRILWFTEDKLRELKIMIDTALLSA